MSSVSTDRSRRLSGALETCGGFVWCGHRFAHGSMQFSGRGGRVSWSSGVGWGLVGWGFHTGSDLVVPGSIARLLIDPSSVEIRSSSSLRERAVAAVYICGWKSKTISLGSTGAGQWQVKISLWVMHIQSIQSEPRSNVVGRSKN